MICFSVLSVNGAGLICEFSVLIKGLFGGCHIGVQVVMNSPLIDVCGYVLIVYPFSYVCGYDFSVAICSHPRILLYASLLTILVHWQVQISTVEIRLYIRVMGLLSPWWKCTSSWLPHAVWFLLVKHSGMLMLLLNVCFQFLLFVNFCSVIV